MNTFLALCMFTCFMSCHPGKMVITEPGSDTTLLARVDKPHTFEGVPAIFNFIFSEKSRNLYDSNGKTWLLFDDPLITEKPDGVYEIYVSDRSPNTISLKSTSPDFVNVLDLYSITAPGASQVIGVDISSHLKNIYAQKHQLPNIYVTLVFSGNLDTNGRQSKNAGKLQLGGIRLLQTKG